MAKSLFCIKKGEKGVLKNHKVTHKEYCILYINRMLYVIAAGQWKKVQLNRIQHYLYQEHPDFYMIIIMKLGGFNI